MAPVLEGWLAARGVERGENESLAEAVARAMGMARELLNGIPDIKELMVRFTILSKSDAPASPA
ncbi:MAG: hypothetical protein ACLP6W_05375 [Bryobacteraceae bacterium]